MGIRAMLNAFWDHDTARRPERPKLRPNDASLKAEADLSANRTKAMEANNRASMGVVLDATRAMATEARIRLMLGGMIGETDRGKVHDDRH
jgi:hypothetical protein